MRDGVVAAFVAVAAAGGAVVDAVGSPADAAGIGYHVRSPIAVASSSCLVLVEGFLRVSLVDHSIIDWDGPKIDPGEGAIAFHDGGGRHVSLAV